MVQSTPVRNLSDGSTAHTIVPLCAAPGNGARTQQHLKTHASFTDVFAGVHQRKHLDASTIWLERSAGTSAAAKVEAAILDGSA